MTHSLASRPCVWDWQDNKEVSRDGGDPVPGRCLLRSIQSARGLAAPHAKEYMSSDSELKSNCDVNEKDCNAQGLPFSARRRDALDAFSNL